MFVFFCFYILNCAWVIRKFYFIVIFIVLFIKLDHFGNSTINVCICSSLVKLNFTSLLLFGSGEHE